MIVKRELNKALRKISPRSAYYNYTINPETSTFIRVFPLLYDKSLIYTNNNNSNNNLMIEKNLDLFEERIFVPVAISEDNIPSNISIKYSITRKKIFDESLFSNKYKEIIKKDYTDEDLKTLLYKNIHISPDKNPEMYNSVLYSLNWDLIFTQIFKAPIISNSKIQPIINYKYNTVAEHASTSLSHVSEIGTFLKKVNYALPHNLDIDDIKSFRRDKVAMRFRNWINSSLLDLYEKKNLNSITVDDYLHNEFKELLESYKKKTATVSMGISGLAGGAVGAAFSQAPASVGLGAVGGMLANASAPVVSDLIIKIWKQLGPNPWVFLLNDIKLK